MGAEDEPTQVWGFKVLDGEEVGGRNGILDGVNHLSEIPGLADLRMRAAGCWEYCSVRPCSLLLDLACMQVSNVHCQHPISLFLVSVFT